MANNFPPMGPPIYNNGQIVPRTPINGTTPAQRTATRNAQQVKTFQRKAGVQPRDTYSPMGPQDPVNAGGPPLAKPVADNVRAMQQFLKNRGYNITVDGVRGPQTNAAVLAFHQHVDPQHFNNPNASPLPRGKGPGGTPPGSGKVPPGGGKVPPGGGKVGANAAAAAAAAANSTDSQLIDPAAYASGSTNAQYDPQIAELLHQLTSGKTQQGADTKQIQDWYNQAMGVAAQSSAADAAAARAGAASYNAEGNNVANLFGGPDSNNSTASEAAAFHDINLGNMAADAQAQGNFDRSYTKNEALQGAQAQRAQFNLEGNHLKDLASQLVSLRGAKGQAYSAAYQQGVQNRTQQEAAQQQLDLAKAMEPAQLATANANAKTAAIQAAGAGATAKTQLAIARVNLKRANAETQQIIAGNGGTWNLAHPDQQGAFQKALETNVMGPRGGLSMSPDTAWSNLQQQLQMNGLSGNPQAEAIAKGTFIQAIQKSHALGNFGGWAWNGTKLIKTGNSYKVDKKTGNRVLVNSKGKVIPDYKP